MIYLIITQYAFSLQSSYHSSTFSNIRDLIIQWRDGDEKVAQKKNLRSFTLYRNIIPSHLLGKL